MADELLDQVFGEATAEPAPAPEPQVEAPVEPTPEPEVQAEPTPEPPSPVEKPEHSVPLAKYLDTRDELKELKRWKAEQEARQAPVPKAPDPIDDPEGHTAYLRTEMNQALQAQRLEISQELANEKYGEESVDAAMEWAIEKAKTEPGFGPRYMQERNPIDWIVRQHKRDSLVSQLPTDVSSLDELIEREIAKRGLSAQPAAQVSTQAAMAQLPVSQPPKSIASEPAAPATNGQGDNWLADVIRR